MSDIDVKLPAPPVAESTTSTKVRGRRALRWAAVGLIVIGGVAVARAGQDNTEPVSSALAPAVVEPVEPAVNWEQAITYSESALQHMNTAKRNLEAFDVQGAASELDAAAYDQEQMAVITADEPTVSQPISSSAAHLHTAADYLRAMKFGAASREMEASTSYINQATAAGEALLGA
jgi:hypothetical protein